MLILHRAGGRQTVPFARRRCSLGRGGQVPSVRHGLACLAAAASGTVRRRGIFPPHLPPHPTLARLWPAGRRFLPHHCTTCARYCCACRSALVACVALALRAARTTGPATVCYGAVPRRCIIALRLASITSRGARAGTLRRAPPAAGGSHLDGGHRWTWHVRAGCLRRSCAHASGRTGSWCRGRMVGHKQPPAGEQAYSTGCFRASRPLQCFLFLPLLALSPSEALDEQNCLWHSCSDY